MPSGAASSGGSSLADVLIQSTDLPDSWAAKRPNPTDLLNSAALDACVGGDDLSADVVTRVLGDDYVSKPRGARARGAHARGRANTVLDSDAELSNHLDN